MTISVYKTVKYSSAVFGYNSYYFFLCFEIKVVYEPWTLVLLIATIT